MSTDWFITLLHGYKNNESTIYNKKYQQNENSPVNKPKGLWFSHTDAFDEKSYTFKEYDEF